MFPFDIKSRFGTAVRARRKGLGISQEELADRAGLHRTYVADVERGARNLSLESIVRLAQALETSLPTLFSQVNKHEGESTPEEPLDILLVEDDAADVELTLRAFERARLGNRIHVVRDGAEALDYLHGRGGNRHPPRVGRPQVILLDLNLPIISGLEVLRRIKAEETTRMIPVVVLTGSEWDRDIEQCRRLGVESYIVKPLDFQRFSQVTPQLQLGWVLRKLQPATPG